MLVPQSGGEAYSLYGVRGGVCGWRQRSDLGVLPTPSGGAVSKVNAQYSAFAPNILFLLQVPSKEEVGFFFYLSASSDQISRSVVSDSLQPHESQHARPPCPSPTPGVH